MPKRSETFDSAEDFGNDATPLQLVAVGVDEMTTEAELNDAIEVVQNRLREIKGEPMKRFKRGWTLLFSATHDLPTYTPPIKADDQPVRAHYIKAHSDRLRPLHLVTLPDHGNATVLAHDTELEIDKRGTIECPSCKGSGDEAGDSVPVGDCFDCEGDGRLTRSQQYTYYGEGGTNDHLDVPEDTPSLEDRGLELGSYSEDIDHE